LDAQSQLHRLEDQLKKVRGCQPIPWHVTHEQKALSCPGRQVCARSTCMVLRTVLADLQGLL
jgi:hypothetical protein